MGSCCSPTLFKIKTEDQSIYTEIQIQIQILTYHGVA